ncbi:hypothetical protein DL767_003167 [Monosporascus sp. MG133]|nr:hypothetical protein DL767_003167 [Monosporascus sp. MG133]
MAYPLSRVLTFAAATYAATFDPHALFGPRVSDGTLIASASDAHFSDVVSPRWSSWEAPDYDAAIKPATEADLQAIVQIAVEHNITFLSTTNGHGTALGYGDVQGALNINLGYFNSVTIDTASNSMTAGGGVRFGDIFGPLAEAGKELPTGNAVCVGLVGATIGGGIGVSTGLHGLTLDALKSVRVITAVGELVTASKETNPDLFWAIRGAGANFGIITSATYEIYDQTNDGNVILGSFTFPASANTSVWEALQSFDDYLPPELALAISMSYNRTSNQPSVSARVVYWGTQADAQPYLDQFASINPITSTVVEITAPELYSTLSNGVCRNGARINTYTLGLGQTDVCTFEKAFATMVDFYETHPNYTGVLVAQRYSNEKVLQVPESETSHPWRDTKTYILLNNIYNDPSIDADVYSMSRGIRSRFQATSGYSTPHVYVNYNFGDEGPAAKYGPSNLPRLRELKAEWDPENFFGTPNPLY